MVLTEDPSAPVADGAGMGLGGCLRDLLLFSHMSGELHVMYSRVKDLTLLSLRS